MSISAALSSALSGIGTVSKTTEIVSSNIANAQNPSYGRRAVEISSRTAFGNGGGVQIDSISRVVSNRAIADTRLAQARLASDQTYSAFYAELGQKIGLPGEADALTTRLGNVQANLIAATAEPSNGILLNRVAESLGALANKLNQVSATVQSQRSEADADIGRQVDTLNDRLTRVADLNTKIITQLAHNGDASALMDQRQKLIDEISGIVPIREVTREHGRISLFTEHGATLLDGKDPVNLGFAPAGTFVPEMQVGTPPVSFLMLDGELMSDRQFSMFSGGSLSAAVDVRDNFGPKVQAELDALAADLYTIFADLTLDDTIDAGDHGLFTDALGNYNPENELGFSGRITLAALIDPTKGGESWRIRDGLNSVEPGSVGDTSLLMNLAGLFDKVHAPASEVLGVRNASFITFLSNFSSSIGTSVVNSESASVASHAYHQEMQANAQSYGVDTDIELQNLMQLEVAYAANARVIQAAMGMLDTILEIR
ncbi:MAG: flagellar hook-associated protein FlgK [Paracoccus sp. (in: a-proteobacteria)]|uniref:flagellar hook-associated protein FlgK n=1 Tax=Paracoccus sp. TaxID=267 RepID=UPI0026DEB896|nr:flagellar hook-associated protein FlgK [Paracoccus sp. (in: a-proteobacteria)]MDO5620887.1 flagellar hook-associated protein FlgK [Paracoccus sp. (in: a-proteobacteria)]